MRKLIISICLILFAAVASAQFSITGKYKPLEKMNGVKVIILDSIISTNLSTTFISYLGAGTNINWYKYSNLINCVSCNQKDLSPEDATGYILEVDGKKTDNFRS
ncbi:MAG: hypothetical protein WCJ61_11785 [Paludibacter sp.]